MEDKHLAKENIESIEDFLNKSSDDKNRGKKFFLGLSGGVDSTTLGTLISQKFGKNQLETYTLTGDWISKEFTNHAIEIGNEISNKHKVIDISEIFSSTLLKQANPNQYSFLVGQALTLMSNQHKDSHKTVISGNLPEKAAMLSSFGSYLGEFAPLGNFLKCEIYGMANKLGVSREVILRVPGSGVKNTLTDEEVVGVSYPTLEAYLLNINIIETGGNFSIEYYTRDRKGIREICKLTIPQLAHLERRILESTRYWIREGPLPNRKINNIETEDIRGGLTIGPLFRPESYSIFPSRTKEESLGIVPLKNWDGDDLGKLKKEIRTNYNITKNPKSVVILTEDEKVILPEYFAGGVEITTITRGEAFYNSGT